MGQSEGRQDWSDSGNLFLYLIVAILRFRHVQVLYIDYGNRASVSKSKLGSLPASFHTQGGYAKPYSLALTQLPPDEDLAAQALQGINEKLLDKTVKLNVEYK